MSTLKEVLRRMWSRPLAQVPDWLRKAKRSMTLDQICVEMRSSRCYSIGEMRTTDLVTETRSQRHKRARETFAKYPELAFEDVARAKRLGYSEDTMLALRGAAIGDLIRQGRAR